MTTPCIEEMVEEFNDMLARNWGEKSSIYEVLSTGREKDWLRQALTQAKQAGRDEAVKIVESMRKSSETLRGYDEYGNGYIAGRTNAQYNQALDDTLKALQDKK